MAAFSRGVLPSLRSTHEPYICEKCRHLKSFSTSPMISSGHSRWSTIKHDKGKADAVKNKQRSIFSQEITTASKLYGGDPNSNPRLATLIATAKKAGFPKASIETAIARGQGVSTTGAKLDSLLVEAIVPPSVALVIDCQTENKARTLSDVRLKIKDYDGKATPTNHLFEKKGRIVFQTKEGVGLDEVDDIVLEMDTEAMPLDHWQDEEGRIVMATRVDMVRATSDLLAERLGLEVATSEILWDPIDETRVTVDEAVGAKLGKFSDEMLEVPGVQNVYMNAMPQNASP